MSPQSPPLTVGGTVVKESVDLDILGVAFDAQMTHEACISVLFPEQLPKGSVSCESPGGYFMISRSW